MNGGYWIVMLNLFDRLDTIGFLVLMIILIYTSIRRWHRIGQHNPGINFVHKLALWFKRMIPGHGKDAYSVSPKERARIIEG